MTKEVVDRRLGPIQLAPGYAPMNALSYLFAAFITIGMLAFVSFIQPYLINANLQIPTGEQGRAVSVLGFSNEIISLLLVAPVGALADKIGRRPVYMFGALFSAVAAFPFFLLVGTLNPALIMLAFAIVMGIGCGAMFGPQAVYFAELFGPRLRYSGFAFARELGSIIAGGPAPLIAATLVAWMAGAPWGVAVYVIAVSLVTAFAVWCGPETYKNDISEDDVQDRA